MIADELGDRGAAVGLPSSLGGLPYDQLGITGFGVAEAADTAASFGGFGLRGARVIIQGFGAVGRAAAKRFGHLGSVVVGVSTTCGALYDSDGLDVDHLLSLSAEAGDGCVLEYGSEVSNPDDLLSRDADVLVPAAREDTVDEHVAALVKARLVVEGANMPTTVGARALLHARGVDVVPDFIANAGGVVAAAHAMERRRSPFRADPSAAFAMVSEKIRTNTEHVLQRAHDAAVEPHEAALVLAQGRVEEAMRARGRTPGQGLLS